MNSIKQQIIARLLALAEPLKTDGTLRLIARKRTLFLLEPIKPALHLVVGDETVIGQDFRGYTCEIPVLLKLILADTRDAEGKGDELAAYLQKQIESDDQLSTLAVSITYDGELPFTEEELKPEGGTVLAYVIQYRRERAGPETSY